MRTSAAGPGPGGDPGNATGLSMEDACVITLSFTSSADAKEFLLTHKSGAIATQVSTWLATVSNATEWTPWIPVRFVGMVDAAGKKDFEGSAPQQPTWPINVSLEMGRWSGPLWQRGLGADDVLGDDAAVKKAAARAAEVAAKTARLSQEQAATTVDAVVTSGTAVVADGATLSPGQAIQAESNQGGQVYPGYVYSGSPGKSGSQGSLGSPGNYPVSPAYQGYAGSLGTPGSPGSPGSLGSTGGQGYQDSQGYPGYQGYQGYPVYLGNVGPAPPPNGQPGQPAQTAQLMPVPGGQTPAAGGGTKADRIRKIQILTATITVLGIVIPLIAPHLAPLVGVVLLR